MGVLAGKRKIWKRRKLQLCGFFVQSDDFREVDEARTAMITFAWDVTFPGISGAVPPLQH